MKKILLIISIILLLMSVMSCGDLPETFKVIYHSNGSTSGYPPTDNKEYKSGEYATVLDQGTMLNSGHTFGGWNTKSDNSGDHYNTGDRIQINKTNVFLFPVWE